VGTFLSIIFAIISFLIWYGANKDHVERTGFNLPSANARKRIRRNARRKGISEAEAHAEWVVNKRARLPKGTHAPVRRSPPVPAISGQISNYQIIEPAVSDNDPEPAFLISSPVQAEMFYKGHTYNLHSDYTVSGVLNGAQVRWKSVHSFRRWVDARIAAPIAPLASPHEPALAPSVDHLVEPPQEPQPERPSHGWALVGVAATLVVSAAGGWVYVSRVHPGLGASPVRQDPESDMARALIETSAPASSPTADHNSPKVEAVAVPPPQREKAVTKRSGNIRERPDKAAPISKTAQAGMSFHVFMRERDWVQIGLEKPWGWMHSSLLKDGNK
jgi:hypothetical protein